LRQNGRILRASAKRAIYQMQVTPLFNHTTYSLTSKTVCLFSFLFIAEGSISA